MKILATSLCLCAASVSGVSAQDLGTVEDNIAFGIDDNPYSNDGECDDRRFIGPAMATELGWAYVGLDASDCLTAYRAGTARIWDFSAAREATQCEAINFGDDSGAYPMDNECDDPRFEGPGAALALGQGNLGSDASDCSRLCAFGVIALRDY